MLIARARVVVTVKPEPSRFRPSDVPLLVGDPRRIRQELGWTPEIPIERTLDDLLEYWRSARGRPFDPAQGEPRDSAQGKPR
jgi:GDP-4-dehydro-6-deoxy-D-mannose reductase